MSRPLIDFIRRCSASLLLALFASSGFASALPPLKASPVQVPRELAAEPFDQPRSLSIPAGFRIAVLARVAGARFLASLPNGDLLVSRPEAGEIVLLRPNGDSGAKQFVFAKGMRNPHDIVYHRVGAQAFIYIAESHQVSRFRYQDGDTQAGPGEVVAGDLPDDRWYKLLDSYGHPLKNIAVDSRHRLYVAIASATNVNPADAAADPVRGSIYRYAAPGKRELYARGLRNAEGLAWVPGTDELWVVVNNRDQIPFPAHRDFDGDGSDDYGKVMPSYVDNHPPEEFIHVREHADFGWPFANPNPDTPAGMRQMPFEADVDTNRDWKTKPEGALTRIDRGIQAHSAPLGLTFLQDTAFPAQFRNGAVVALHGSWNRQRKTGYKLIYFPWNASAGQPEEPEDLVSGWLDEARQTAWGRPVDMAVDPKGDLLISDDQSGTIYQLSYVSAVAPPVGAGKP